MKYCIVRTCRFNKGTREDVRMFRFVLNRANRWTCVKPISYFIYSKHVKIFFSYCRFPKNEEMALKWRMVIAAGAESNSNNLYGMICVEHFKQDDLIIKKNEIKLQPNAVPNLQLSQANSEEDNLNAESDVIYNIDVFDTASMPSMPSGCEDCEECDQKAQKIDKLRSKIDSLQIVAQKWRQKTYHREKINNKLAKAMEELEKEIELDSNMKRKIEVFIVLAVYSKLNRLHSNSIT